MTLSLDPQVADATAEIYAARASTTLPEAGDWESRRRSIDKMFARLVADWPAPADVSVTSVVASTPTGHQVPARLYRSERADPGSLVVYAHGGGMFACSIDTHDPICRRIADESGVPVLSVDFLQAPEHPYPATVEDVYAVLQWAAGPALGCDPTRIAVMGDSAGGGIAAAVSLMARDRGGVLPAAQVLVYPMLDDRTASADPATERWLMWTPDDNVTAWGCLLGDTFGSDATPSYAAPARASDLTGLPRTYLDVGQLDLYRDEDLAYANRLASAGIDVELHMYAGAPHAFELFAPDSDIAQLAWAHRIRFLRSV